MSLKSKKNCPHIEKLNLIDIEKFKKIPFEKLKCQNCNENNDIWICLICGECFCSKKINSHFIQHNKDNEDHFIYIGLIDLNIRCNKCETETKNNEDKTSNLECYIDSNIVDKYAKVINEFKSGRNAQNPEKLTEEKNIKEEQKECRTELNDKNEICSHIKNDNIISNSNIILIYILMIFIIMKKCFNVVYA